jgi:cyclin-dependent kinase regulatory subunit CKS1
VQLPKQMLKVIPKDYFDSRGTLKLLWEDEWRALGITQVRTHRRHSSPHPTRAHWLTILQSLGWEHYEVHEPEPHILLFK